MRRSVLSRSRREFSQEYSLAKCGFDTAENKPCKVYPLSLCRKQPECMELSPKLAGPKHLFAQARWPLVRGLDALCTDQVKTSLDISIIMCKEMGADCWRIKGAIPVITLCLKDVLSRKDGEQLRTQKTVRLPDTVSRIVFVFFAIQ